MDITTITSIVLPPITAAVGWLAGTRKRRNDAIGYLQQTIDGLAEKNAEYMMEITNLRAEVAQLRAENAELQKGQAAMKAKLDEISRENATLRCIIESKDTQPTPTTKKRKINGTI